jgi:hypothetical protein
VGEGSPFLQGDQDLCARFAQDGHARQVIWPETDVMIFKIFSPKNSGKNWRFWLETAKLCKILIITLVFEKNANFFCRKLSKIAENRDHNIDPWNLSRGWYDDEFKYIKLSFVQTRAGICSVVERAKLVNFLNLLIVDC